MSNSAEILPVEAWFRPAPDGGVTFQSPFVVDSGTFYGVEVKTSEDLDPNKLPAELVRHQAQQEGLEFFEQLRLTGAQPYFNLWFTDARFAADLGPEGSPDPVAEALAESDIAIYGMAGSLAMRGYGILTPPDHPRDASGYTDRLWLAAMEAEVPLFSCDPKVTADGKPDGPAERTLDALGDSIRMLASDETDAHGGAQMFADIVYCSHLLGGLVLPQIGNVLREHWLQAGMYPEVATLILPGELLDAARLLPILGIPKDRIHHTFVTDDAARPIVEEYQVCMQRGGIPPHMMPPQE